MKGSIKGAYQLLDPYFTKTWSSRKLALIKNSMRSRKGTERRKRPLKGESDTLGIS